MILQASFGELNDLIAQKTDIKGLSFAYSSPDTLGVSMTLSLLGILNPTISAKVKIVSIEGSRVTAEIDAGSLGDFMLDKAKKLLFEKVPEGLIECFDNKQAVVNLEAIPELKSVFDAFAVNGLAFTEEALCLDASLK